MRNARGRVGDWEAKITPGGEVLACIHLHFCQYDREAGLIRYRELFSDYGPGVNVKRCQSHIDKIVADGKAIITTSKIDLLPDGKIASIRRSGYVAIMEVHSADIINDSEIQITGKIVERLS